jgi:hypothetical protein
MFNNIIKSVINNIASFGKTFIKYTVDIFGKAVLPIAVYVGLSYTWVYILYGFVISFANFLLPLLCFCKYILFLIGISWATIIIISFIFYIQLDEAEKIVICQIIKEKLKLK